MTTPLPSSLRLRTRLICGEEIAMGPGKADLLDAIDSTGSISAAGRLLGMSYRRTWLLVDAMNRCWQEPLVTTATGGSHGGGAAVTEFGKTVLARYRALQEAIAKASAGPTRELEKLMLREPRPPKHV